MRTVVLVHGAWHGGWCWDRVVPLLRDAGVETVALDLPGRGGDPGPEVDLHADSAALRHRLDAIGGGVLLVGHSYGGAVITEAGEHPRVDHLVYLSGFPLDRDESCAHAAPLESAGLDHDGRPDLGAGFISADDGTVSLDPALAAACFYSDCDGETTRWALDQLEPQQLASLTQSPTRTAWRVKPSTYVVAAHDMAVHPDLQRILARRCTTSIEWPTGHSPFLSQPDLVADLLTRLAGSR
jgi:pimeloyl-ACP methyl ester carboxylesterase